MLLSSETRIGLCITGKCIMLVIQYDYNYNMPKLKLLIINSNIRHSIFFILFLMLNSEVICGVDTLLVQSSRCQSIS